MTILQILFLAISAITLIGSIMVVASPNLFHAALWLVLTLAGVAVFFVLLQASFLAMVQVVVYIGAIAILVIFAVMLTRRAMHEDKPRVNRYWWLGTLAALMLFAALVVILSKLPDAAIGVSELPIPEGDLLSLLGMSMVDVNGFVLPFEVASVLLLAALIGSIVIARPIRRGSEEGEAR
jgi:NADH:ubiquinone oxidoreductase subunit 6 (subunit J)